MHMRQMALRRIGPAKAGQYDVCRFGPAKAGHYEVCRFGPAEAGHYDGIVICAPATPCSPQIA